jgi:hypothetical protein
MAQNLFSLIIGLIAGGLAGFLLGLIATNFIQDEEEI